MFFHQTDNSIGDDIYNGIFYRNASWGLHLHRGFELILVLSGELQATVDRTSYCLRAGEAVLILPYQLHEIRSHPDAHFFIAVFSGAMISSFSSAISGLLPPENRFTMSEESRLYLLRYLSVGTGLTPDEPGSYAMPACGEKKRVAGEESEEECSVTAARPERNRLKSCLYAVAAEFEEAYPLQTWQKKTQNDALIFQILNYIETHYAEDITLSSAATALCYEYHYLSRMFHETLQIHFRTLVNQYRCEHAKELILSTDEPLSVILEKCGFQSVRSFNRIFLEIVGCAPSRLRAGKQPKPTQVVPVSS